MATEMEAAIANELGFAIDDLVNEQVTDAEDRPMGTTYADTTVQPGGGGTPMLPPNQFVIVLANGKQFGVTVTEVHA